MTTNDHALPFILRWKQQERIDVILLLGGFVSLLPALSLAGAPFFYNDMSFDTAWALVNFSLWATPAIIILGMVVNFALWVRFQMWCRS